MPPSVDRIRGARNRRGPLPRGTGHGRCSVIAAAIRFAQDRRGSTAIEYGLICGLIFLVIATALHTFADRTQAMYGFIGTKVSQTP